jgi:hypothetical protein
MSCGSSPDLAHVVETNYGVERHTSVIPEAHAYKAWGVVTNASKSSTHPLKGMGL